MSGGADKFGFLDLQPQVNVEEVEYLRLLGYPRHHALEAQGRELADWVRGWYGEHGRPWIFARAAGGAQIEAGKIVMGGAEFESERLEAQFAAAGAHDAMLVAVSAGSECEEKARACWQEGKPDEYFFLEMYGSAVVENLVASAAGRICARADQSGMAVLPHYSPGYSGWPVSDQVKLWSALRGNNGAAFPARLEVMETGMLRPKKSLLTVFGLTRQREKVQPGTMLVPCENCSLARCQYRRAAYRRFMPQSEAVVREQSGEVETTGHNGRVAIRVEPARYTVNARALRKWSQERLQLEVGTDGGVRARFRFEGTTCSNLGRPILYDYHVVLQARGESYWITEAHCSPAEGDTGNAHQCEYLKDPVGFMRRIAVEQPFLNRQLNEVLAWTRPTNPAGCYCDAGSRAHKWGMVFEVIHFALAQGSS